MTPSYGDTFALDQGTWYVNQLLQTCITTRAGVGASWYVLLGTCLWVRAHAQGGLLPGPDMLWGVLTNSLFMNQADEHGIGSYNYCGSAVHVFIFKRSIRQINFKSRRFFAWRLYMCTWSHSLLVFRS